MLNNTYLKLNELILDATTPILVYVVSGDCWDHKTREEIELEDAVHNLREEVSYIRFCVDEQEMPFPRIHGGILYYFLPRNQTPMFWRSPMPIFTVEDDVKIAYKMMDGMSYDEAAHEDSETREQIVSTDTMLITEDMKKYPSSFVQFRNFAKDMWKAGKQGLRHLPVIATAEIAFERMNTCESCPMYDADANRCRECGCNITAKAHLVTSKCPLDKWPA